MSLYEAFDFDESEASAREERAHWRFVPVALFFFLAGTLAGALLVLLTKH